MCELGKYPTLPFVLRAKESKKKKTK